jgi:HAD superfamily hydrolase (TIGR01509 family)
LDSAAILQAAGVDMEADAIVQVLTDRVRDALRTHGVPFRPGAQELLRELREAGIPTALVTMSLRRMAEGVMDLMDFDAFELIVAGDDVENPKPHPEPYLRGAELLGVEIADAVVIEDSPTGLRAGIASGAVTLGVPHIVPLEGLGAHAIWPTLHGRTAHDIIALFRAHRMIQTEIPS